MYRTTTVLLAACVVSGCIATDAVYPATWAGRVKLDANECPVIDGEYSNRGDMSLEGEPMFEAAAQAYSVESGSISLADMLAGQAEGQERLNFTRVDATTDPHRSVKLHVDGATLHVLAMRADGSSRSFELPVGGRCDGSLIDAGASWDGATTILASSVDRSSMKLGRAEDGALLIRTKQSSGYFITYVPMFGTKDERWIRFVPFTPEPAATQVAEAGASE
jgi:hypothetical protein